MWRAASHLFGLASFITFLWSHLSFSLHLIFSVCQRWAVKMLINNSTRILDDTWDRDKWKTIATSIREQSVVINVLILAGLKRDGRACSWSRRGWGKEEIKSHLPSWHVLNEKERRDPFPLLVPVLVLQWCLDASDVWCCALAIPCFVPMGALTSGCCESLQLVTVQWPILIRIYCGICSWYVWKSKNFWHCVVTTKERKSLLFQVLIMVESKSHVNYRTYQRTSVMLHIILW